MALPARLLRLSSRPLLLPSRLLLRPPLLRLRLRQLDTPIGLLCGQLYGQLLRLQPCPLRIPQLGIMLRCFRSPRSFPLVGALPPPP